jgi:hypothetical protein
MTVLFNRSGLSDDQYRNPPKGGGPSVNTAASYDWTRLARSMASIKSESELATVSHGAPGLDTPRTSSIGRLLRRHLRQCSWCAPPVTRVPDVRDNQARRVLTTLETANNLGDIAERRSRENLRNKVPAFVIVDSMQQYVGRAAHRNRQGRWNVIASAGSRCSAGRLRPSGPNFLYDHHCHVHPRPRVDPRMPAKRCLRRAQRHPIFRRQLRSTNPCEHRVHVGNGHR